MWFFRKKLTQEQRISLGKLAEELNSLTQAKEAAFAVALRDVADLLANCMAGQDSGAGRPLVPPAASEIIAARETLLAYEDTARPSISELERVDIPEWAPSKFAEHRRQVLSFWESHFKFHRPGRGGGNHCGPSSPRSVGGPTGSCQAQPVHVGYESCRPHG